MDTSCTYSETLEVMSSTTISNDNLNPSPSGDAWFENKDNVETIKRGIEDVSCGRVKQYSLSGIQELLGL